VILCNLVNTLRPGLIKKINTGKMPFLQMENINAFLTAIEAMGIAKIDSFMTVGTGTSKSRKLFDADFPLPDLYEAKNLVPVVDCILAIKKRCP